MCGSAAMCRLVHMSRLCVQLRITFQMPMFMQTCNLFFLYVVISTSVTSSLKFHYGPQLSQHQGWETRINLVLVGFWTPSADILNVTWHFGNQIFLSYGKKFDRHFSWGCYMTFSDWNRLLLIDSSSHFRSRMETYPVSKILYYVGNIDNGQPSKTQECTSNWPMSRYFSALTMNLYNHWSLW